MQPSTKMGEGLNALIALSSNKLANHFFVDFLADSRAGELCRLLETLRHRLLAGRTRYRYEWEKEGEVI